MVDSLSGAIFGQIGAAARGISDAFSSSMRISVSSKAAGQGAFHAFCALAAAFQAVSLGLIAGGIGEGAIGAGAALGAAAGPFGAMALAFALVLCARSALRRLDDRMCRVRP